VRVSGNSPTGTFLLTVTGTGGGLSRSTQVTLVVRSG
jgi:hypothetical protein